MPLVVGLAIFCAYFVAARLVGNLYPLSTFEMYSRPAPEWAARVFARDADGRLHRVDAFVGWRCPDPTDLRAALASCGARHIALDYVVRDDQVAIDDGDPSPAGEPVELISRAQRVATGPGERTHVCRIATCTATRRGSQ